MRKALIVDDSKTIRMVLGRTLRELGYAVCEAANGKDALKVIESEKAGVEVVLVDWNMPEMNGLDLVIQLRKNAELASVKLIMATNETQMDHVASALEAGANEYLVKPFTKTSEGKAGHSWGFLQPNTLGQKRSKQSRRLWRMEPITSIPAKSPVR